MSSATTNAATESEKKEQGALEITCPCGKCKIRAINEPLGCGVCHCNECRVITQGVAFEGVAFPKQSFETLEGNLVSLPRPDGIKMTEHRCGECLSMLYHTEIHELDILGTSEIRRCGRTKKHPEDDDRFLKPAFHCWYSERLYDVDDELPKFSDSAEAFGGTGKMLNNDGTPKE